MNVTKQEIAKMADYLEVLGGDEELLAQARDCVDSPPSETDFWVIERLLIEVGGLI